jgi:5'-3' exonuclease
VKVHLVDGTYELFRAYYGVPPATAADGREVGAVRGLLRSLLQLLREPGVSHVAVAFDSVIESFRNRLFAGYKTGEGIPPDLLAQFPLAEQAASALGLVVWPMHEFEADDAVATAAARCAARAEVEQVVIASPDKDFAQCVAGARVVCLDRRRQRLMDEAGVVERFGIPPASIPDWLALVGDSSDGIPGLPGWGERSAAVVLARHGRLEAIPDDPAKWGVAVRGAERLAAVLRERRADARLYRELATLRLDVPLAERLEELAWAGPNAALDGLTARLGEPELAARAARLAGDRPTTRP